MKKICLLSCVAPLDFFQTGKAPAVTAFAEDELLAQAFAAKGITADRLPWDQKGVDWRVYDAVIVKSTWDYYVRCDEFLRALDDIAKQTKVFNSPESIRWNSNKRYLLELEQMGVPVVPTVLLENVTPESPLKAAQEKGWSRSVVKPTVSGGALSTYRLPEETPRLGELRDAHTREFILQPFLDSIVTEGEWSFLFFNGKFQYATVKLPASGDYRVQGIHGGTSELVKPSPSDLAAATMVLEAVESVPLIARVDMARSDAGELLLMELEIIEPFLWLSDANSSAALVSAFLEEI